MKIAYDSPTAIRTFLEEEGLAMSKRFGQNFLVDRHAREKLYATLPAEGGGEIWEIGPGIGAMTSLFLEQGRRLKAFEIDHGFVRILNKVFGDDPRFSLVEGDFLKTWKAFAAASRPEAIFGNLPYNAALAIIADLLEYSWVPPRIIFTVQKEAAQRIVASPGTKDYSAFSVLCSSVCTARILYDIGASSFWPRPRVTSSVIILAPRPVPVAGDDRLGFSRFVRAGFSSRRKTLRNNLAAVDKRYPSLLAGVLDGMGVSSEVRAEALTPEQLAAVYSSLKRLSSLSPAP